MTEIVKFRAGWNAGRNQGWIVIRSSSGDSRKLDFDNPAEFGAVLQILTTSEQAFVDNQGTIWSGAEDVEA